MNILDFTVEETSLIAIYAGDTREATLANMTAALPDMDSTMRDIAERSAAMLTTMSDEDFQAATFTLADEDDLEPETQPDCRDSVATIPQYAGTQ